MNNGVVSRVAKLIYFVAQIVTKSSKKTSVFFAFVAEFLLLYRLKKFRLTNKIKVCQFYKISATFYDN